MSFDAPGWLALLLALPILVWLRRILAAPRVVEVSSVLLFRDDDRSPSARARRTRLDPLLACVATAVVALALAAAGPTLRKSSDVVYVVVDDSPSMAASPTAVTEAVRILGDLLPGVRVEVRPLGDPQRPPADSLTAVSARRPPAPDALPESLAPHLRAARAAGFPGVLLVTDGRGGGVRDGRRDGEDVWSGNTWSGDVVVVGPSGPPAPNVALTGAVLDGDDMVVTVRNFRDEDLAVVVTTSRSGERRLVVPAGGVGNVTFPAPNRGASETCALDFGDGLPGDLLADDSLTVNRLGGARTVRPTVELGSDRVRQALVAYGAEVTNDERPADVWVRVGGDGPSPPGPGLDIAPGSGSAGGSGTVGGAEVTGWGTLGRMLPSARTLLVARGRVPAADRVSTKDRAGTDGRAPDGGWSDGDGALVARVGDAVVVALDPDAPGSTWHLDPSFPVLLAMALDILTDGPDRLEIVDPFPPSESDLPRSAPPTPTAERIRGLVRSGPGPTASTGPTGPNGRPGRSGGADTGLGLGLLAAGLLGVAAWLCRGRVA